MKHELDLPPIERECPAHVAYGRLVERRHIIAALRDWAEGESTRRPRSYDDAHPLYTVAARMFADWLERTLIP